MKKEIQWAKSERTKMRIVNVAIVVTVAGMLYLAISKYMKTGAYVSPKTDMFYNILKASSYLSAVIGAFAAFIMSWKQCKSNNKANTLLIRAILKASKAETMVWGIASAFGVCGLATIGYFGVKYRAMYLPPDANMLCQIAMIIGYTAITFGCMNNYIQIKKQANAEEMEEASRETASEPLKKWEKLNEEKK